MFTLQDKTAETLIGLVDRQIEPSDPVTALHHVRSTLGKVRFSLEQECKLVLSTKLAEAQIIIGEVLKEIEE